VRAAVQAGGAAGGGREEASSLVRCWYGKALDSLHAYMDTKFEMLCSSLADASTINVPALISGHANIMDDIVQVWGRVVVTCRDCSRSRKRSRMRARMRGDFSWSRAGIE
jgi:hypothetical protein